MGWTSQTCLLVASMFFCGNRIREDLFQKGWWNGLPQFCKHLSMKVCGLDIPDLCVVLIVLESCS